MAYTDWLRIGEGTGPGVIVAIDFESGRPEPGFRDLARRLAVPYGTVQPTPPAIPPFSDGRGYVRAWAAELAGGGVDVAAVFGYCASGSLACSLALELGREGRRPHVFLVDPHLANGGMVYYQFLLAVQQFERVLEFGALDAAQRAAHEVCSDPTLSRVTDVLPALYRDIAEQAFEDLADDDVLDELCGRFSSYLGFLLAGRSLAYADSTADCLAVFSTEYDPPDGYRGRMQRIGVPHMDLLNAPEVTDAVHQLLGVAR
ncbi:MAG TPA: hypothetical protein VKB69_08655 [Micromonosporaceae bacterium]|nr:hypothetical protein [Micromonosporaceae bacterium]